MSELEKHPQAQLLLVDGNSIINRAYFAMSRGKRLTAPDGTPTAAVFAFFNMLFSYMDKLKPEKVCICFDRPEATFRKEIYPEYKAGRREMDEDLAIQIPIVKEGLEHMGISQAEKAGYEADDLIATLCKRAVDDGLDNIYVLSGDRDLWQLINDQVTLIYPYNRSGSRGKELMTPQAFIDAYGFEPVNLLDYKALKGDSSDNIPGVKGIGEKTGMALIGEYKTLENVYANIDQLKPAQAKRLREGEDNAHLSYQLAKLEDQVPLEDAYTSAEFDLPALTDYFTRLNINSFWSRFDLDNQANKNHNIKLDDWEIVDFEKLLQNAKEEIFFHYYGTSIALANDSNEFAFLKLNEFSPLWDQWLERGQDGLKAVFWSGKEFFREFDLTIPEKDYFDVEIVAYLLNQLEANKSNAENFQNFFLSLTGTSLQFSGLDDISEEDQKNEAMLSLAGLRQIRILGQEALEKENIWLLARDLEFPLARILAEMEKAGIKVDREALANLSDQMADQIHALENQIYFYLGKEINLNSSKQLGEVLFEEMKLPGSKKTKSGAYSTAADVLEPLIHAHPVIPLILEYRELSKLLSTFVDGLGKEIAEDGRVHTHFKQTLTTTGRLSSSEPNLQNIPVKSDRAADIRDLFVSEEGMTFIDADYSQIELRLLAALSGDENLLAAFQDNEDIHTSTAIRLFNKSEHEVSSKDRRDAKTVNFSIIYGISDFGLARNLDISVAEAKELIDNYNLHYPKVRIWMDEQAELAKKQGYVETILGRRRYIPELKSKNFHQRKFGERAAMNAPVQGSAADLIKLAMIRVDDAIKAAGIDARLILQVHDELVLEVADEAVDQVAGLLKEAMEDAMDLVVPLKVEVSKGKSWGNLEDIKNGLA